MKNTAGTTKTSGFKRWVAGCFLWLGIYPAVLLGQVSVPTLPGGFTPSDHRPQADNKNIEASRCDQNPGQLYKQVQKAYAKLLQSLGHGEGGKLQTPEQEAAYKEYAYYRQCLDSVLMHAEPAHVTPKVCLRPGISHKKNPCFQVEAIILVRFQREVRKGSMRRWYGDQALEYEYQEISRDNVDLAGLPASRMDLEPGFYKFEFNNVQGYPPSGYYGSSELFEVRAGERKNIMVWVVPAI